MNKHLDFDTWFDLLQEHLRSRGVAFHCRDSVRSDYDNGTSPEDVADDIAEEYGA